MNFYLLTDIECAEYLENLKWGNKPLNCTLCDHNKAYKTAKAGKYKCPSCNRHFTIKSKTLFENTKIPLNKWFKTIYLVLSNSGKLSSVKLSQELNITQKTAWGMLKRLQEVGYKIGVNFGSAKGANFPLIAPDQINSLFRKALSLCINKPINEDFNEYKIDVAQLNTDEQCDQMDINLNRLCASNSTKKRSTTPPTNQDNDNTNNKFNTLDKYLHIRINFIV